ncbi:MAG TPA: SDR family oxidoreductase [Candidatus Lustribacter sp.]|nr:SDR family oxidoreductase [Candidatus Lustribacter sp.]
MSARVAVVTGGANNIGLAIARRLAAEGMAVIAVDWDEPAILRANAATEPGSTIRFLAGDVGTPAGARAGIDAAIETYGRLDLLCNNAAVQPLEGIEEHALESWREAFRVNVEGTMLCTQLALPHMRRQGSGTIVNMGSISGQVPYARGGAYAASKAAIEALTKVTALEAGPFGVRVNCICAGAILPADRTGDAQLPIGRFGRPDDVAQLVTYLASDAASYMTGSIIVLDGGATAGRERKRP